MTVRHTSVLLFLAAACVTPVANAADALGRLFLTPEKRVVLEQQRQFNIQERETLQGSTMSLDGVVVRNNGKKTVWINGRAQNEGESAFGLSTRVAPGNPGQAKIEAGDGASTNLRVGQKINRATSEIQDGLEGGRLEVKRPLQAR